MSMAPWMMPLAICKKYGHSGTIAMAMAMAMSIYAATVPYKIWAPWHCSYGYGYVIYGAIQNMYKIGTVARCHVYKNKFI